MGKWPPQMSANMWASEFQCPCCGRLELNPLLVLALQWFRDRLGKPVVIHSGYRCNEHNNEISGSPQSQHLVGNAADVTCLGETIDDLAEFAEQIPYFNGGGIGKYDTHLHVDVRDGPARWDSPNRNAKP